MSNLESEVTLRGFVYLMFHDYDGFMDFSQNKSTCDWVIVNSELSNPTDIEVRNAIMYFFRFSDNEHPSAWISCGTDDGPFYILTIFRARRNWYGAQICEVDYQEYDDQDMNTVIEEQNLGTFSKAATLNLWRDFKSMHLR